VVKYPVPPRPNDGSPCGRRVGPVHGSVIQDLLIAVTRVLEEAHWMWQAQLA
jgi:hypothetical protein